MPVTKPGRTLARLGIAALLAVGALFVPTSTASADGCMVIPAGATGATAAELCGRVYNYSTKPLYTTSVLDFNEVPNELDGRPHNCEVWNGEGGSSPASRMVSCYQVELGPESAKGGNYVDVDAFTYADRDYMVDFHGKLSWQTEGVWTRISSLESAYCYTDPEFGFPKCLIEYL